MLVNKVSFVVKLLFVLVSLQYVKRVTSKTGLSRLPGVFGLLFEKVSSLLDLKELYINVPWDIS